MKKPIFLFTSSHVARFFVLLCALSAYNVQAAPAPFGLELGKAKLSDIESKYPIIKKTKNAFLGYNHFVEASSLPLEGVLESTFICDDDSILQGVVLSMNQHKFDDMFRSLSKKYQIQEQIIPFVGNKKVTFEDEDCFIFMNAPHMDFNMKISYVTKKLDGTFKKTVKEEEQARQSAQEAAL